MDSMSRTITVNHGGEGPGDLYHDFVAVADMLPNGAKVSENYSKTVLTITGMRDIKLLGAAAKEVGYQVVVEAVADALRGFDRGDGDYYEW